MVIPNSVPYAASKAAGNLVIAKFAAELKGEGMVLLSVAPGGVATEGMTDLSARECSNPGVRSVGARRLENGGGEGKRGYR